MKIDARSYEVLHLSRKVILASLKIWYSKMQPLSGKQCPDLLTSLMTMSLCTPPATRNASLTSKSGPSPSVFNTFDFEMCFAPQRRAACTFSTSQLPKSSEAGVLCKNSCHNGVHFFNISTSKSSPTLACFVHFDFQMCFAPQQRALFHTFSTSQRLKVRFWCVLYLLTSKLASRHNGVQLFISQLATWLRTRFSEPTFEPPEPQIIGKNTMFRDFATFSRTCIFFLLALSLLWSSLFCSSLLWLFPPLLFPSVHTVGSLTSKLPSVIYIYISHIVHIFHRNLTRYISWDTYICNLTSM